MMKIDLKGMDKLMASLGQLEKRAQANVLRGAVRKAARPLVKAMKDGAPFGDGDLERSIKVSTRTKGRPSNQKGGFTLYVGPSIYYAHFVEFGTSKMDADPYVEPAWESDKDDLLERIKTEMAAILIKKGLL